MKFFAQIPAPQYGDQKGRGKVILPFQIRLCRCFSGSLSGKLPTSALFTKAAPLEDEAEWSEVNGNIP
jgi:hypothetical protein